MLERRKEMVICKGKDKTSSIEYYEFDERRKKYLITFNNGGQYEYSEANIAILTPQPYDMQNKFIFYKGAPVIDFEKILLFADAKHQFLYVCKNSGDFSAPESRFTVSESAELSPAGQRIFSYLHTIAALTASDTPLACGNTQDKFLATIYAKLKFIHPESVLAAYLNHGPMYKRETPIENIIFPFRFNLSQKAALEKALTHSVSIIEGPPGTGKTQTILNILANLTIVMGKSVGVVSFNNEAVKNVKDKLDKQKYGFLVADLGRAEKRENFFQNLPTIDVAEWKYDDKLEELQARIKELNQILTQLLAEANRLAQLKQELAAYHLEQQHFEQYFAAQQLTSIEKLPFYARTSSQAAEYLADIMLEEKLRPASKFLHKLKLLFKYKEFRFGKLKKNEIDILLRLQRRFYALKILELEEESRILSEKLKKNPFKVLQDEHQRISERIFQKKLFLSHSSLDQPDFSAKDYTSDYKKFIKYYPIILSTNHSLRNSIPQDYLLDYIIIDEASQVDLLSGVLALSCCKNLIIVGDLKQLPQIVDERIKSKIDDTDIPPEYDYFKQSILSSFLCIYHDDVPRVILKEHYRCHPQIIQFCNQKYYNGELIPFTDQNCCNIPLMLYKTSAGNHMRTITCGDDRGRYNQRELDAIKQEVLQNVNLASDDIGVVTPYRKQAQKAFTYLPDRIKSDTIHKFQGRENDVIIMSTVLDSSRSGKSGVGFVDEACLVNVAVSRARKQFVLVTDNELFQKNGHHVHELLRYIQYNTLDEHIINSQIVSVFDLLYKNYSNKLDILKSKLLYRSRFMSENIIYTALKNFLQEPKYSQYYIAEQVMLRNIIRETSRLDAREADLVNNRASVDFVIYNKQDKKCALIIEVDGFEYHENNPEQLKRDAVKNSILDKYAIPLLRLATNGSGEIEKVKITLDGVERSQAQNPLNVSR